MWARLNREGGQREQLFRFIGPPRNDIHPKVRRSFVRSQFDGSMYNCSCVAHISNPSWRGPSRIKGWLLRPVAIEAAPERDLLAAAEAALAVYTWMQRPYDAISSIRVGERVRAFRALASSQVANCAGWIQTIDARVAEAEEYRDQRIGRCARLPNMNL